MTFSELVNSTLATVESCNSCLMGISVPAGGGGCAVEEAPTELEPGSDGGGKDNGATGGVEAAGASGGGGKANKGVAFDLVLPLSLALALALVCLAFAFLLFTVLGAILSVTMDTMSTTLAREWWGEKYCCE